MTIFFRNLLKRLQRQVSRKVKGSNKHLKAMWRQFFEWLEYYGQVLGKIVIAVPPQYTSRESISITKHRPKLFLMRRPRKLTPADFQHQINTTTLEHRFSIQNPVQFLDFGMSQKAIFR